MHGLEPKPMAAPTHPRGRRVLPETLDELPPDDAHAIRSRRDLRRVNQVMGVRAIFLKALRGLAPRRAAAPKPIRILELGSGDGTLLLGVARGLGAAWRPAELTLLDRQDLVAPSTVQAYHALGWDARSQVADVFGWFDGAGASRRYDLIVANLFLHHFEDPELARLCRAIAAHADAAFACEPRRAALARVGSRLIGALGVNAVTRQDAVLSVDAGFRDRELTALWPQHDPAWRMREYAAGLFSHCLLAERVGGGP